MIMKMFCLLDIKVGSYGSPFFFHHHHEAIRAASELAQDQATIPGRYPADFGLYEMGEFDNATGQVTMHAYPQALGVLRSFLPPPKSMPLFDQSHIMKRTTEQIERDEAQWANGAGPMHNDNAHAS